MYNFPSSRNLESSLQHADHCTQQRQLLVKIHGIPVVAVSYNPSISREHQLCDAFNGDLSAQSVGYLQNRD
jgi:hypothetical protein